MSEQHKTNQKNRCLNRRQLFQLWEWLKNHANLVETGAVTYVQMAADASNVLGFSVSREQISDNCAIMGIVPQPRAPLLTSDQRLELLDEKIKNLLSQQKELNDRFQVLLDIVSGSQEPVLSRAEQNCQDLRDYVEQHDVHFNHDLDSFKQSGL